jgi:flavodoxin
MKIAIVYFSLGNRTKLQDAAKGLSEGLSEEGHRADLIDATKDINTKLTMYEYIAVGAEAENFWGGKIDPKIGHFLSNAGILSGKRSFAFITQKGIRQMKTLKALMDTMEHEGMFLKNSTSVASYEEAKKIGRSLIR